MKHALLVVATLSMLGMSACKQKEAPPLESAPEAAATQPATTDGDAAAAPADEVSPEKSEAQAKLDYATLEDGFLSDTKGQWATAATASWGEGESHKPDAKADAYGSPNFATGTPDAKPWILTQNRPGFDWLELSYDKPVSATEVRIAFLHGEGVEAINKIELIDVNGTAHTVWSGLSDVTEDERGDRTWFVRKFDATPYQTQKVKVTIANNVQDGYKHIDAVQLIGG